MWDHRFWRYSLQLLHIRTCYFLHVHDDRMQVYGRIGCPRPRTGWLLFHSYYSSWRVYFAEGKVIICFGRNETNYLNNVPLQSLISGRFAQSLTLGAYSYLQNPDPYVLTTSKRGWEVLRKLWLCPQNELYERWNRIIDSYVTINNNH